MQKPLLLPDFPTRSSTGFVLCLAFTLLVVIGFNARPIPFKNEFIYLLRLDSGFLPNDWSFAQAAAEHWLFNFLFQIPAALTSIETVGWVGRVVFWIACLAGLIKVGRRWQIPFWAIAFSISLWLAFGQSVVNAEWMFGTFEAKVVAYACLLFALDKFASEHIWLPGVLLGLAFSFHPAVGFWAIPSVGFALLAMRRSFADLAKIAGVTLLFCLPGIVPLLTEPSPVASADDWQFVVTVLMPYHLDPYYFSRIGVLVVMLMGAFNVAALWRENTFGLRFLRNFQIAIAACFLLGFVLRFLEFYPPLRLMPMRLLPIITPIFFLFTAFRVFQRAEKARTQIAAAAVVLVLVGLLNPMSEGVGRLRDTRDSWRAKPDDFEMALAWISTNTPTNAVIISTPNHRKLWYLSQRSHVASYFYPRYDRLGEWRSRVSDLTGGAAITEREQAHDAIATGFHSLTPEQISALMTKYGGTHLVTSTDYVFPVIFEAGAYKVYELP